MLNQQIFFHLPNVFRQPLHMECALDTFVSWPYDNEVKVVQSRTAPVIFCAQGYFAYFPVSLFYPRTRYNSPHDLDCFASLCQ